MTAQIIILMCLVVVMQGAFITLQMHDEKDRKFIPVKRRVRDLPPRF
jgi:hypothetical protein